MLIDTHCHLDFSEFNTDRDDVIRKAKAEGVGYIINIGSSLEGSKEGVNLSRKYDCVFASVGIHPHDADKADSEVYQVLDELSKDAKAVAIGEIGLDYYRNLSSVENQKKVFVNLLELANRRSLPVIIHCRQAQEDLLAILEKNNVCRGVVHCFSGDEDFLRCCLDLGLYISFTCNLTYKKAQNLRDLAKLVPLERILLETDAPFLPPEGFRGKRNEPAYVKYLAEKLAEIKNIDLQEIARISTENAKRLFELDI